MELGKPEIAQPEIIVVPLDDPVPRTVPKEIPIEEPFFEPTPDKEREEELVPA